MVTRTWTSSGDVDVRTCEGRTRGIDVYVYIDQIEDNHRGWWCTHVRRPGMLTCIHMVLGTDDISTYMYGGRRYIGVNRDGVGIGNSRTGVDSHLCGYRD